MSFPRLLYWADRALKGDRRPVFVIVGWLLVVVVLIIGMSIYE